MENFGDRRDISEKLTFRGLGPLSVKAVRRRELPKRRCVDLKVSIPRKYAKNFWRLEPNYLRYNQTGYAAVFMVDRTVTASRLKG